MPPRPGKGDEMPTSKFSQPDTAKAVAPVHPGAFWSAPGGVLYLGDVRACLRQLPARSAHCVVTSPPYWGLRDYGTGQWEGGSADCDHMYESMKQDGLDKYQRDVRGRGPDANNGPKHAERFKQAYKIICRKCGAKRTDMQIGAEPIANCGTYGQAQCGQCFVCSIVGVIQEVHRVLRDDGTLWLNLGDTFDGGEQGMIPALVALALRKDGWKLIQDIIWHSSNKMPESVTNRCTKSHEHIFLLAKGDGYYYDSVSIEEPAKGSGKSYSSRNFAPHSAKDKCDKIKHTAATGASVNNRSDSEYTTANKRDVWIVSTSRYPGAHFATFSPRLITPCILAGTSEHGCCARCGRPWERVISERETVGWRKVCGCQTNDVVPCTVLDPFVGSGTTVATSIELGRNGIGIDLSEVYLRENAIPRIEASIKGGATKKPTVPMIEDTPPIPRKIRG